MKALMIAVGLFCATVGLGAALTPAGVEQWGLPLLAVLFSGVFVVQWLGFLHALRYHTEHYYDLLGSLSFIGLALAGWYSRESPSILANMLVLMVVLWALRLGSFLFLRVREVGEDRRFRSIKVSPARFFMVWTLQGVWVCVTSAAAVSAISSPHLASLHVGLTSVGVLLWLLGLSYETIADLQKTRFRRQPENSNRFITTGLWSRSQHPNYFGEILLWIGVALVASAGFNGWQWLAWVSPCFVFLLLTKVSGIPTLAQRARTTWGDDEHYRHYVAVTPLLVPKIK